MEQRSGFRVGMGTALLYALAAGVFLVWPMRDTFNDTLLGTLPFPHDAVLNAGILEWVHRALWDPRLSVFDWTGGFPLKNSLAGTEHLLGWQLIYSPARWAGVPVAAAYNLCVLSALVVAAAGASLLARHYGADVGGSVFAGVAFAFNPFLLNHAIHLQTMAICWSPFAFLYLDRTFLEPGIRNSIKLTASIALSFLFGMYFGVLLLLVMTMYCVVAVATGARRLNRATLLHIGASVGLAVLVLSPLLAHYVAFAERNNFYQHSATILDRFSLHLGAFLRAPKWQAVLSGTPLSAAAYETQLPAFPGVMVGIFSIVAIFLFRPSASGRYWRIVPVALVVAVACAVFAMGPYFRVHSQITDPPSRIPMPGRFFTLVSAIRWPMRIYLYTSLFLATLAGLGVTSVRSTLLRRSGRPARAFSVAAVVLLLIELRPAAVYSHGSGSLSQYTSQADGYTYLASDDATTGIAELPSNQGGWATPLQVRYTYQSSIHLRRVVAFHGSVVPSVIDTLRKAIDALPLSAAIETLAEHGVNRVVIHRGLMKPDTAQALVAGLQRQGLPVLYDKGVDAVFGLPRNIAQKKADVIR